LPIQERVFIRPEATVTTDFAQVMQTLNQLVHQPQLSASQSRQLRDINRSIANTAARIIPTVTPYTQNKLTRNTFEIFCRYLEEDDEVVEFKASSSREPSDEVFFQGFRNTQPSERSFNTIDLRRDRYIPALKEKERRDTGRKRPKELKKPDSDYCYNFKDLSAEALEKVQRIFAANEKRRVEDDEKSRSKHKSKKQRKDDDDDDQPSDAKKKKKDNDKDDRSKKH
jgi:hypothetical protein